MSRQAHWRSRLPLLVLLLVIGLLVLDPRVPIAFEQPALRLVIDTVVALVALLLSYLLYGRYLLRQRLSDLVLTATLALAAVVNAGFAVAPQLVSDSAGVATLLAWGPACGRVLVAGGFASAALVDPLREVRVRRAGRLLALAALAVAAAVAASVVSVGDLLPTTAAPDLDPSTANLKAGGAEGVLTSLRWASAALYAVAAFGFSRRHDDDFAPRLVVAMVLLAFARVNYALVPSLYAQWVYLGDLLRLGAYGVLLTAASQEIRRYWVVQAQQDLAEERRRLATSLHDGLAQEAALVAVQTRLWAAGRPTMEPRLVAGAAERALDESRAAIGALTGDLDESLDRALQRVADDLSGRLGLEIRTHVAVGSVPAPVRDALVRAVREAVGNASRHGRAERVDVEAVLEDGAGIRVSVTDNGAGFDPQAPADGFGLVTARARVAAVGGTLTVSSVPGGGARVDVEVPWTA